MFWCPRSAAWWSAVIPSWSRVSVSAMTPVPLPSMNVMIENVQSSAKVRFHGCVNMLGGQSGITQPRNRILPSLVHCLLKFSLNALPPPRQKRVYNEGMTMDTGDV